MTTPTDGITKARISGTGGTSSNDQYGGIIAELRYSPSQDKTWVRAKWDLTEQHPDGPLALGSGFSIALQGEVKNTSSGATSWVTIATTSLESKAGAVISAGYYDENKLYDPDTFTKPTGTSRTRRFRVKLHTGTANTYAHINDNRNYYSAAAYVK